MRIFRLQTKDEKTFEVNEGVIRYFKVIDAMIDDVESDKAIPLVQVESSTFEKVLEYVKKIQESGDDDYESSKWKKEFFNIDQKIIFELILASSFLHFNSLLMGGCKTIAKIIQDNPPDKVREILHIENDLKPEQIDNLKEKYRKIMKEFLVNN